MIVFASARILRVLVFHECSYVYDIVKLRLIPPHTVLTKCGVALCNYADYAPFLSPSWSYFLHASQLASCLHPLSRWLVCLPPALSIAAIREKYGRRLTNTPQTKRMHERSYKHEVNCIACYKTHLRHQPVKFFFFFLFLFLIAHHNLDHFPLHIWERWGSFRTRAII